LYIVTLAKLMAWLKGTNELPSATISVSLFYEKSNQMINFADLFSLNYFHD